MPFISASSTADEFHQWLINSRCVKELSKLTRNDNPSTVVCLSFLEMVAGSNAEWWRGRGANEIMWRRTEMEQ